MTPPISMQLKEPYLKYVFSGLKYIEGRLGTSEWKKGIAVGRLIRFNLVGNIDTFVECKVVGLERFGTFREMLMVRGMEELTSTITPLSSPSLSDPWMDGHYS